VPIFLEFRGMNILLTGIHPGYEGLMACPFRRIEPDQIDVVLITTSTWTMLRHFPI
jgi:hypothetical protein